MVVKAYGCTSTFALVILFMKELLPTFGRPHRRRVRVFGSNAGRRDMCFLTSSR